MQDIITRERIAWLQDQRAEFCASIYLPTHRAGQKTLENPIRFKNLLQQLEQQFEEIGARKSDVETYLERAYELVDQFEFWQHQSDGLAVFISEELFGFYRVPLPFDELVVLTDRFHLKPLLPMLSGDGLYYLLALSKNDVRLFRGSRYSINQVDLEGVPGSLAEALRFDEPVPSLQHHVGDGQQRAMYHGHGVGSDDARHKQEILQFFRKVNDGIQDFLSDRQAPLVLAGVDYHFPLYREANSYEGLTEQGVPGNPEHVSIEELHERSWAIVQPIFEAQLQSALESYGHQSRTDKTSDQIEEIVKLAAEGRIDTLFVEQGVRQWGFYHPEKHEVVLHDEKELYDEDLTDYAAFQTIRHGGEVFVLTSDRMPENAAPLAALLRA